MKQEQITVTNNNELMEEKKMKGFMSSVEKKLVPAISGGMMGVMLMSTTCLQRLEHQQ